MSKMNIFVKFNFGLVNQIFLSRRMLQCDCALLIGIRKIPFNQWGFFQTGLPQFVLFFKKHFDVNGNEPLVSSKLVAAAK